MANGLKVDVEEHQNVLCFRLDGRLDATSTPQLESKINEQIDAGKRHFVLDFGRIDYLSSAGMRLLLSATRRLKSEGGQLNICSINEDVMEIIKVAGFERILNIFPTEAAAMDGF